MSSAIIKSEQELQCTCLLEWNCRDRESWRCWWFWGQIKQILAVCDDCCSTSHVAQILAASGYTSETNLLHFEQSSDEKKIKGYALCSGNCNKKEIEIKPEQSSKFWARQNLHRSYETKKSAADRLLSIWLVLDIKQWSQKQWRWQTLWIPHHFFTPNSADRQSAPPPWKLCYKNTELIFGCVVELWESFKDMHWQSKQKGGQHYYNGRWSELPIYQQQVQHVCSNGEEAVREKTLGNNNLQEHYKEIDRERMSSRERWWENLAE